MRKDAGLNGDLDRIPQLAWMLFLKAFDGLEENREINFASSDDIHTMAHLYESMLKDMRDAAGDSGEFYTPRPVIRFMLQQVGPRLGEIVLDPAGGTGGFLVEALEELEPKVETTQQLRKLHESIRGVEKKPLPYLLGMMNLVLHGVGNPNVVRGNALDSPITQISRADRVDVVLTNRRSAARRRRASRPTSRPTSRLPRRHGSSCNW